MERHNGRLQLGDVVSQVEKWCFNDSVFSLTIQFSNPGHDPGSTFMSPYCELQYDSFMEFFNLFTDQSFIVAVHWSKCCSPILDAPYDCSLLHFNYNVMLLNNPFFNYFFLG